MPNGKSINRRARASIAVMALLLMAGVVAAPAQAAQSSRFRTAVSDYSETYERDVFVIPFSTLRNPDADTPDGAPLFSASGVNLNLTWGQWKAARGTALIGMSGTTPLASVTLTLRGLVPGGVYSVFYGTILPDSENPLCPGVERTLPLNSVLPGQRPDRSSFVASSNGRALFSGIAGRDLLSPIQTFFFIVYHSDGKTYNSLPNGGEAQSIAEGTQPCRSTFGLDAMRQMIVVSDR